MTKPTFIVRPQGDGTYLGMVAEVFGLVDKYVDPSIIIKDLSEKYEAVKEFYEKEGLTLRVGKEVIIDDDEDIISIDANPDLIRKLTDVAEFRGTTLNEALVQLIDEALSLKREEEKQKFLEFDSAFKDGRMTADYNENKSNYDIRGICKREKELNRHLIDEEVKEFLKEK